MNYLPALFLLLAAALGGLRSWEAMSIFAAASFICLAFFDDDFSASGLGIWGLLALWLAAGLAFSPEPLNSFRTVSGYLLFFSFYIFSSRRGPAARGAWIRAVLLLGVLASGASIAEAVMGLGPGGLVGVNPNYGAGFMAAGVAGAAALLTGSADKKRGFAAAALLAFLSVGLMASRSRGGLLGALSAVLYLLLMKKAWRPAFFFTAGLLLAAILLPGKNLAWLLKLEAANSLERMKIWQTALEAITAAPLFGAGAGLFERAFEALKFPFYNGISFYGHYTPHAHSAILNLAAESGIPAACLLIWGWGRGVFSSDDGDRQRMALKVFAVSLFVQAAVDIIFYSGAMQLFFFGTLGLLAAGKRRSPDAPGARARALSVLLCCWCAAGVLHHCFERDKACALDRKRTAGVRDACRKKAAAFAPGDPGLLAAAVPLSTGLYGNYAYAAALAEEAALARPKDPFPLFERAEAFYLAGAGRQAKEMYLRVLAVEPAFLRARLRLAGIFAAEKNYRGASAELDRIKTILEKKTLRGARWLRPGAAFAALRGLY
jgi:O-antigen ligase